MLIMMALLHSMCFNLELNKLVVERVKGKGSDKCSEFAKRMDALFWKKMILEAKNDKYQ